MSVSSLLASFFFSSLLEEVESLGSEKVQSLFKQWKSRVVFCFLGRQQNGSFSRPPFVPCRYLLVL